MAPMRRSVVRDTATLWPHERVPFAALKSPSAPRGSTSKMEAKAAAAARLKAGASRAGSVQIGFTFDSGHTELPGIDVMCPDRSLGSPKHLRIDP